MRECDSSVGFIIKYTRVIALFHACQQLFAWLTSLSNPNSLTSMFNVIRLGQFLQESDRLPLFSSHYSPISQTRGHRKRFQKLPSYIEKITIKTCIGSLVVYVTRTNCSTDTLLVHKYHISGAGTPRSNGIRRKHTGTLRKELGGRPVGS